MSSLQCNLIAVVPTLSAGAYSDLDQIGSLLTLTNAVEATGDYATVISLVVIDKGKQKAALDVLFFSEAPTVASADNDALSISDAEMAAKFIGRVSVPAASYVDSSANSDCTVKDINLLVKALAGSKNLFCILQSRGTPTYPGTTDLTVKIGFSQT